jgi:hypothetical protein
VEGSPDTVINLRVPKNVGKLLDKCTIGGFSRRTHLHGISYTLCDERFCLFYTDHYIAVYIYNCALCMS